MNNVLTVGEIGIQRIIEIEGPFLPALDVFPTLSAELLDENRGWLAPRSLAQDDRLVFCFQSYVVRTPHHNVLVDTCIGNDKARPARPQWNLKRDETFMRGLAAAGLSVDDIDFVMCTHLHVDHVGWNTRLQDGRWTPTFPKARYLISKGEFDFWEPKPLCRISAIACSRSWKPGGPNGCATTMRLTTMCAFCRLPDTRPTTLRFASGGMATMRSCPGTSSIRRCRPAIPNCPPAAMSMGIRPPRRVAAFWNDIATRAPYAAWLISRRRRLGESRAGTMGFAAITSKPDRPAARPGTYLRGTAGSQRHFSLAKVLRSKQPSSRRDRHLANIGLVVGAPLGSVPPRQSAPRIRVREDGHEHRERHTIALRPPWRRLRYRHRGRRFHRPHHD